MRRPRSVSLIAACSAASASGLRSVGPTMREPPGAILERGQRADEEVARLARHDRPDAQQFERPAAEPSARGRGIGARLGNRDLAAGHREVGHQRPRGDPAGDDDPSGERQRILLESVQRILPRLGEACLQAERMVHEGDDGTAHAADQLGRQGAVGQTVDHDDGIRRDGRQQPPRFFEVGRARIRKRSRQLQVPDGDAEPRQQRQHAAVVDVAAGAERYVAWNGEDGGTHADPRSARGADGRSVGTITRPPRRGSIRARLGRA